MNQNIAVIHMAMHRFAICACFERMGVYYYVSIRNMGMVEEKITSHEPNKNYQQAASAFIIIPVFHNFFLKWI
ncbi:MAG: hypothetical protein IPN68_04790 [Bacteroidetes bacterium]|nr:hypothetical protein [Bacteroidota bacterium]